MTFFKTHKQATFIDHTVKKSGFFLFIIITI